MLRFIARFLGFWLLAGALVTAVVDGARSIAASALVTTPLMETWATIALYLGLDAPLSVPEGLPWPFDMTLAGLYGSPTVVILAILGVFFLVIGAKRRRPTIGREFAT